MAFQFGGCMAGDKTSDLTAEDAIQDADLVMTVDVSDTSMAATGTNKKTLWSLVKSTLKTYFDALYAAVSHTHAQSDVTGLVSDLAGKAASVHTHSQSDVTNLMADLAAKVPSTRTINGYDLSVNRTLTASDVGAISKGADGSGSNSAGTATTITPGRSTGNATPSGVILQSTVAGVSGATIQTAYDTVEVVNGMLIVRQPGGTAGVDEGRIYDTGTVLVIERMTESGSTDAIALKLNGTNYMAVRRAQGGVCLGSGRWLTWATDPATAVPTSGINQEGVGLLAVIDGTNSANYRDIKARDFIATRAMRLASSTVAALPTAGTAGRVAYASNGRRSGEGSGAGTGCPVWDDGTNWKTFYDNTTVQS